MSEIEIDLARAYLVTCGQDPVMALIRSVKDLVRMRDLVSPGYVRGRPPLPGSKSAMERSPWLRAGLEEWPPRRQRPDDTMEDSMAGGGQL